MRHPEREAALGLLFALSCASCSAPESCDPSLPSSQRLESEEHRGSLLLSKANEQQTLHFRATLSGLAEGASSAGPSAWQAKLIEASMPLELSLQYESEPFGQDGHTEMPRLTLSSTKQGFEPLKAPPTDGYPAVPIQFGSELFQDCARGSSRCETALDALIERLDGAPFPPVSVTWRATAHAQLGVCTTLNNRARVELEAEAP